MCHNSRDEIQDIISKLENISLEVKDIQGEQRVQSKMMESRENQLVSSDRVYFNIEYILYLLENPKIKKLTFNSSYLTKHQIQMSLQFLIY